LDSNYPQCLKRKVHCPSTPLPSSLASSIFPRKKYFSFPLLPSPFFRFGASPLLRLIVTSLFATEQLCSPKQTLFFPVACSAPQSPMRLAFHFDFMACEKQSLFRAFSPIRFLSFPCLLRRRLTKTSSTVPDIRPFPVPASPLYNFKFPQGRLGGYFCSGSFAM